MQNLDLEFNATYNKAVAGVFQWYQEIILANVLATQSITIPNAFAFDFCVTSFNATLRNNASMIFEGTAARDKVTLSIQDTAKNNLQDPAFAPDLFSWNHLTDNLNWRGMIFRAQGSVYLSAAHVANPNAAPSSFTFPGLTVGITFQGFFVNVS